MDHILSADEKEKFDEFIPKIPWLGFDHTPSEHLGTFDDYALQRGWSREKLLDLKEGRLGGLEKEFLKPFLQSWFSIGLWEAALGKGLEKDDFVVSKSSKLVFTSESLRQIIKNLETSFKSTSKDDPSKVSILSRFNHVLRAARMWNRMLGETQLFIKPNLEFCDETYHSVMRMFALLGVTLQYTGEFLAIWVSVNFRTPLQYHWSFTYDVEQTLRERMVKCGWCPYIRTMLSPFNVIVAEYAAVIGPSSTYFSHHSCSAAECVRHNIDEGTYKPLHTHPDCQCSFVRPSLDRIAEILDHGQIPLMDFNKISDSEGKSIEAVPFEPNKTVFTAVSHVWSGGFGSTSEAGLPQCALDRLAGYMEDNDNKKLVWIDSLCIPRGRRLRKLSIHSINKVYSLANTTLVLDPELMRSPSSSTRQMLLWITTAAWMQRMWTLPEGRLSRLPYIAFKNGAGLLQHLLMDGENEYENPVTGALIPDLFGLFSQNINELRYIHQSLCYRTTSKREDEVPALAALFNVDTRPILNTQSLDERMAIFWIALRGKVTIPVNIIFLTGHKLSIPGLRWAPSSLLNAGRQLSLLTPPQGVKSHNVELSDDGTLTGTYVVIRLDKRAMLLLNKFNPIRLSVLPEPGSRQLRVAPFTLLAFNKVGTDVQEEGILQDIDAFALNVTNPEARAGESLASELLAAVRSVVALTLDHPESQAGTGTTQNKWDDDPSAAMTDTGAVDRSNSFSFRARYLMQLSPIETTGNELISGNVRWARISIS
ncbi:uncharacterized protein Z518_03176 [Rhinocladiella mackenziei CBS 650.93]|uniref:Heterokaryon incompatibility domain-containing protein n=1 Tax=Rhinocladiella mackenziei CBS 650.93 TaxID=1442369 RepID=A0A0D2JGU2_9EURO|nr:uncharacterized protein Z518_03176 [Rhinocladiella mackenziei CBS 650.93]KIX08520.1 hypothetical protein Z518_03176 [Rhinocladiella mackenziei CBS 650.93]